MPTVSVKIEMQRPEHTQVSTPARVLRCAAPPLSCTVQGSTAPLLFEASKSNFSMLLSGEN